MNTYNMFGLVLFLTLLGYLQIGHAQLMNVAEGKPATQIGTSGNSVAGLAVDGDLNLNPTYCSYAYHADSNTMSWWMVDLGSLHAIHRVIIYSSSNGVYDPFLGFLSVRVSNDPDIDLHAESDECAKWNEATLAASSSETLECDQVMYGRYVSIQRTGGTHLNSMIMCEVMVMGRPLGRCPKITIEDIQKAVLKAEAKRNGVSSGIGLT